MDYDIDMEDAVGQEPQEMPLDAPPPDDILGVDEMQEPGEIEDDARPAADVDVASTVLVPTKVHIRGLDALTPDDIKAYITEHVGSGSRGAGSVPYDRIEWIDDTSANLVFASEAVAAAALVALAAVQIDDVTQLPLGEALAAKTYSAKPDEVSAGLSVRYALASDKKQAGAAARSRFYLLHPEYDPEERRKHYPANRRRHDDRDRDYRRRRDDRSDVQDDREADIRNNSFDVNLYDDDGPALARRSSPHDRRRRRRSYSRSRSRTRTRTRTRSRSPRQTNRDKELFADDTTSSRSKELFPDKLRSGSDAGGSGGETTRSARRSGQDLLYRNRDRGSQSGRDSGRLRDRSASPRAGLFSYDVVGDHVDYDDDYDGRLADERAKEAAAAAARNRDKARAIRDRLAANGGGGGDRDLFAAGDSGDAAQMDLFSNGGGGVTAKLSGMSISYDGVHEDEDEAGSYDDVNTRPRSYGNLEPRKYNYDDYEYDDMINTVFFSLSNTDRITRPAADSPADGSTFNIRGLTKDKDSGDLGISIKGIASARELFPAKLNGGGGGGSSAGSGKSNGNGKGRGGRNGAKDVADNSLASRISRPRQRAEDLFH